MINQKNIGIVEECIRYLCNVFGAKLVLKGSLALKLCYQLEPIYIKEAEVDFYDDYNIIPYALLLFGKTTGYTIKVENFDRKVIATIAYGEEENDELQIRFDKQFPSDGYEHVTVINRIATYNISDMMCYLVDTDEKGPTDEITINILQIYKEYVHFLNHEANERIKKHLEFHGGGHYIDLLNCYKSIGLDETTMKQYYKVAVDMSKASNCYNSWMREYIA